MFRVTYTVNGVLKTVTGTQIEYVKHTRLKVPSVCVMGLTKTFIPVSAIATTNGIIVV